MGPVNYGSGQFRQELQPICNDAISEEPLVGAIAAPTSQVKRLNFIEPVFDENDELSAPDETKPLDFDAPNPEINLVYDYHKGVLARYGGGAITIDDHTRDEIYADDIDGEQLGAAKIGRRVAKVQHRLTCALLNTESTYKTSATGLGALTSDPAIDIVSLIRAQLSTDVTLNFGKVTHAAINETTAIALLKNRSLSTTAAFAGAGSGGTFKSQGPVLRSIPELIAQFKALLGLDLLIDAVPIVVDGAARFAINDGIISTFAISDRRDRPCFVRTYAKNPAGIAKNLQNIASVFSIRAGNPNRTQLWSETVLAVSSPRKTGQSAKNPNGKLFSFT